MTHFRSRFPETKVIFSSGFLTDCLSQLVTDKLDLSVVMIGDHQRESLAALEEEPLFEVDQGVIASASHPIFKPGADVNHQLASCEWLTTVGDEPLLLSKLNSIGITAPRSLTICDFYGIDALNGRHNALSLSPLSVAEDERYENRVSALPASLFALPPLTISFFHRKGVELSTPADYMRHTIRQVFDAWYAAKPRHLVRRIERRESAQ